MDLHVIRTMLFTPANRPERFEKAKLTGADGLVIDLEDAVSLSEKDEARDIVINHFKHYQSEPNFIQCLRVNSIKTPAGLKDLSAIIDSGAFPDVLMIPKVEFAAEIIILDALFAPKRVPYIVLIETATGLYNAKEIVASSDNVKALVFGGGDLAADLGAELDWEPMLNARSLIIRAAATAGISAIDVPYLKLKDPDDTGVIEETRKVKALGYTGKFAIHPKHIKPIIDTFTPSVEEAEKAKRIVDAYEKSGGKVCEIDGKMIDVPIYRSAKRIIDLASK